MAHGTDEDLTSLGRSCWRMLETLHIVGYFAPETTQAYVDLGLHPRLSYFAARSAAFGPVPAEVTTATFYVFAPWLPAKALPASWRIASPEQVQQARRSGVSAALRRLLGEPDVAEALEIAHRVCAGLHAPARPLYAAHAALPWPDDDLMSLWHAATLVREYRGDGHLCVLATEGLDPVESLVLGGLFSGNTAFLRRTRGWSDEEWSAGERRLRAAGLLDDDAGVLSAEGMRVRQRVEQRTDALALEGWAGVGPADCARLRELLAPLVRQVLAGDVLPGWVAMPD